MIIRCPYCNEELELPSEYTGQKVQCAYCDKKFIAAKELVDEQKMVDVDADSEPIGRINDFEEEGWNERKTIWRDIIKINCPKCEADISLDTKFLGGKVRCHSCGAAFFARGEGAMVTEDRNRYREELRRDKEAKDIESCLDWESEAMATLRIGFKVGGRGCEGESDGVYIRFWFEKNFDIMGLLDHFTSLVESIIGYRLRVVEKFKDRLSDGFSCRVRYYVQKDRPCEKIQQSRRESAQSRVRSSVIAVNPIVQSHEEERNRLFYLIHGDDGGEVAFSRNYFCFIDYLRNKYKDLQIFRILVANYGPGDPFCESRGLKDGFGIIVEVKARNDVAGELPIGMIKDMEKRFSRKLTLVKKIGGSMVEYCFTLSMPLQESVSGSDMNAKQRTLVATQDLGKGTGVDWSRENAAFARFAEEYGISGFNVRAVNPYCVQVSIPLSVDEDDVRDFANDLFDELGLLSGGDIDFHQFGPCCFLDKSDDCYYVVFNHHSVVGSKAGEADYKFTVEAVQEGGGGEYSDDEITPEKVMQYIAAGIKSGAIRPKSGEGFFVLEGKYYDQIAAGKKTTEYRDITIRNLSKSIGIKTIKLQRGYKKVQMRYAVESVRLMDANDRECDPYNIPAGFIATTIAIHLGKRIA